MNEGAFWLNAPLTTGEVAALYLAVKSASGSIQGRLESIGRKITDRAPAPDTSSARADREYLANTLEGWAVEPEQPNVVRWKMLTADLWDAAAMLRLPAPDTSQRGESRGTIDAPYDADAECARVTPAPETEGEPQPDARVDWSLTGNGECYPAEVSGPGIPEDEIVGVVAVSTKRCPDCDDGDSGCSTCDDHRVIADPPPVVTSTSHAPAQPEVEGDERDVARADRIIEETAHRPLTLDEADVIGRILHRLESLTAERDQWEVRATETGVDLAKTRAERDSLASRLLAATAQAEEQAEALRRADELAGYCAAEDGSRWALDHPGQHEARKRYSAARAASSPKEASDGE